MQMCEDYYNPRKYVMVNYELCKRQNIGRNLCAKLITNWKARQKQTEKLEKK